MREIVTDVAIIGAGSAGLSAAYQAATAGADVLVAGTGVFKAADIPAEIQALRCEA